MATKSEWDEHAARTQKRVEAICAVSEAALKMHRAKIDLGEMALEAASMERMNEALLPVATELFQAGGLFVDCMLAGDNIISEGFLKMAEFCKRHKAEFIKEMCRT